MKVCLIIPYYLDKNRHRRNEINECLFEKNLKNKSISRVIAVCDTEIKLPYDKKLTVINIGRRQKYDDLFRIAESINPEGLNIIANADIFFKKDDIEKLKKIDYTNTVVSLSRWDVLKSGKSVHHSHKDSQDCWIFKGKINVNGNFELGKAGCDNRIAYEIGLNYNIVNPSIDIKSYHLHSSNIRNYKSKDAIPPPYLRVPCCYYSDKKIKKVLHIALPGQPELSSMLKSFGEYVYIDWSEELRKTDIVKIQEKIIKISNRFNPDFTFMQIQTADIITPVVASQLKGFVMNWSGDVREDISWMSNLAPYVDATCLSNETDTEYLRREGVGSWFFQIGFEHKIFNPNGPKLTTKNTIWDHPEVVFMANNYGNKFPLSKERRDIAKKLYDTYGPKFLLCGNGWEIPAINLMNQPKKEAMVYRSCKIAINSNHFIHKRFSSDRIFRIMGSGAFCLTRWYPGIEKDFIDGVHLRTFKDEDEMVYLINHYLKNEAERIQITEQGCKLVQDNFRWASSKRIIEQIASFPQKKEKMKDKFALTPLTNKEWLEYLNEK